MVSVVKRVIPECAWPRLAGKQVDSQSWDAALDVVQQSLPFTSKRSTGQKVLFVALLKPGTLSVGRYKLFLD